MESVTIESHKAVPSDEVVFKALADPTRRAILDSLYEHDGQTLGELESAFVMSRFGVMKHLRVLGAANLVTAHRAGRAKLHYLNPVPIRELQERWTDKFALAASTSLLGLRAEVEKGARMAAIETAGEARAAQESKPSHVFAIFIRATPERVWEAITTSDYTLQYYFSSAVESDLTPGSPIVYRIDGEPVLVGDVIECEPPTKLVTSFDARWDDDVRPDAPSTISWLIEPAGPGVSKLTVVHDGFAGETATYNQVGGGMPFILSGLKTLLETGEPLMPAGG